MKEKLLLYAYHVKYLCSYSEITESIKEKDFLKKCRGWNLKMNFRARQFAKSRHEAAIACSSRCNIFTEKSLTLRTDVMVFKSSDDGIVEVEVNTVTSVSRRPKQTSRHLFSNQLQIADKFSDPEISAIERFYGSKKM